MVFPLKTSNGKMPFSKCTIISIEMHSGKPYLLANTQILRYYVKPMFFHGKFPLHKMPGP